MTATGDAQPPELPAIWNCQNCGQQRTCLYDYKAGMTIPAYPAYCKLCGDAMIPDDGDEPPLGHGHRAQVLAEHVSKPTPSGVL